MPPPVTRLRNGQPRTRQVGPRRYTAHAAFWHREEADTVAAAIGHRGMRPSRGNGSSMAHPAPGQPLGRLASPGPALFLILPYLKTRV